MQCNVIQKTDIVKAVITGIKFLQAYWSYSLGQSSELKRGNSISSTNAIEVRNWSHYKGKEIRNDPEK